MTSKFFSDDLLPLLLWGAEKLMMPTWRNLDKSFEGWEYEYRLRHHFRRMERRQLLVRERQPEGMFYRLTQEGRLAALGGRDPLASWHRQWDGRWRMVLFDLPVSKHSLRLKLLRWLRDHHFGYLQHSVWIHPDPATELFQRVKEFRRNAEVFAVMEAHCGVGYSEKTLVEGAWDFAEINKRYLAYLQIATKDFRLVQRSRNPAVARLLWLRRERNAWLHAFSVDPLLPQTLLPTGYLGQEAWEARQKVMSAMITELAAGNDALSHDTAVS